MTAFKPMLAGKAEIDKLQFPVLASPKLDGVRATVMDGQLRSRSLKPFANAHVQQAFSQHDFDGLDGEFILDAPTAPDVYRRTNQALATIGGNPTLTFHVFDDWSAPGGFRDRFYRVSDRLVGLSQRKLLDFQIVYHRLINTPLQLEQIEQEWTADGYEGVMLRDPSGPYKFGRSTTKEGWLLKLKSFDDMEAVVLGIEEEMHNANEAKTNELGRTKRSSHQAGKVGKGTMGALIVRGLNGPFEGVEFNVGSGFTAADRQRLDWVGETVKIKYFAVGVKDKPRHPVYLGTRMAEDGLTP